jgi:ATP-dependent protease Clp ATPase subunit
MILFAPSAGGTKSDGIASPAAVYICEDCIDLCVEIMEEKLQGD